MTDVGLRNCRGRVRAPGHVFAIGAEMLYAADKVKAFRVEEILSLSDVALLFSCEVEPRKEISIKLRTSVNHRHNELRARRKKPDASLPLWSPYSLSVVE